MIINHGLFYNNFEGLNNDIVRFRADPFVAYNEQDGMKVFTGGPQGGIVQTPEGGWYSIMFQDYHSVGRIPVLVPVNWGEDG